MIMIIIKRSRKNKRRLKTEDINTKRRWTDEVEKEEKKKKGIR